MAEALTWYKEYWTANEARSRSGEGLVALAPLAVACMAYDAGMPIEAESEYIPRGPCCGGPGPDRRAPHTPPPPGYAGSAEDSRSRP
ncbi:Imm49 family immunity protein [Streptomyces sp. NPDC093018]|uniref:Imm49 family immunity protein n=1 Tax=Streptomyces sp. NPDC093018 TaxID=3155067 RepID=UPI0034414785